MKGATVVKYYSMPEYSKEVGELLPRTVAMAILGIAQPTHSTGFLESTGTVFQIGRNAWEVYFKAPYAAAQEYGRPDLTNYSFNPYMRPAYKQVLRDLPKIIKNMNKAALRKAKKR